MVRLLVATVVILTPFRCAAQSGPVREIVLRGRVIDAETNAPVGLSAILVNNIQATAGTDGRFELRLPRPRLLLQVRLAVIRIGYEPLRQELSLVADSTLDLGTLKLQPLPVQIFVDYVGSGRHR